MIIISKLPRARDIFEPPASGVVIKRKESCLHAIQAELAQDINGKLFITIRVKSRLGLIDDFSIRNSVIVENIDRMNEELENIADKAREYYVKLERRYNNDLC